MLSEAHPWVRQFDAGVGWGLQAIALPADPAPASGMLAAGLLSTEREQIAPSPLRRPGPPLILAGAGERTAFRLAARYADACNFGPGHATGMARTAEDERRKNVVLDERCREIGRDPRTVLRSHFTIWLMLAATPEAARDKRDRFYPDGINEEQQFSRLAGSPDQVAGYYQSLVDAGMQYFVVQTLDARETETIELLAREVVPAVKARRRL